MQATEPTSPMSPLNCSVAVEVGSLQSGRLGSGRHRICELLTLESLEEDFPDRVPCVSLAPLHAFTQGTVE